MKWKKLGLLFDPTKYTLPNNCVEFAQAPQTLIFDDFVRIYFSTREKDANGKYLSHISFVDFDKNFKEILNISDKPVLRLGNLGCYDEHGVFPLNIVRDKEKVLGYIGGWTRRVSVSVDGAIGLATSQDHGLTFTRIGEGPVVSASLNEPFLIGDPFVQIFDGLFHMWYIFGTQWKEATPGAAAERTYKIGHAASKDGITWEKEDGRQIISDQLNDECQALPTVIKTSAKYHMLFCYRQSVDFRENPQRAYRIGYACSSDLKHWIRDDANVGIDVSSDGWDSSMMCYPHVFECDGKIYLLYNGNEFGRFGFGLAILEQS